MKKCKGVNSGNMITDDSERQLNYKSVLPLWKCLNSRESNLKVDKVTLLRGPRQTQVY